jgi:predicted ATP-dependent serine protease
MAKKKVQSAFFCQSCGTQSPKWLGKCPQCNEWNTFVEEVISKEEKTKQRMRDKMDKRQMEKKIEQEVIQKLMNNKELEKNEDGMFVFKDDTSIKISKSKRKKRKNKPKI